MGFIKGIHRGSIPYRARLVRCSYAIRYRIPARPHWSTRFAYVFSVAQHLLCIQPSIYQYLWDAKRSTQLLIICIIKLIEDFKTSPIPAFLMFHDTLCMAFVQELFLVLTVTIWAMVPAADNYTLEVRIKEHWKLMPELAPVKGVH